MRQNKILEYFNREKHEGDAEPHWDRTDRRSATGGYQYSSTGSPGIYPSPRARHVSMSNDAQAARDYRRRLATETLNIINSGTVPVPIDGDRNGGYEEYSIYDACIASEKATEFFPDDSPHLQNWEDLSLQAAEQAMEPLMPANFGLYNRTTLSAARAMRREFPSTRHRIGVLNFASATKPGGGFINGAEAQEESIARSSTLYTSLTSPAAVPFYNVHIATKGEGFYTHSMIYSPGVVVFRDDDAKLIKPYTIDIVTSAAVNAGEVRKKLDFEDTERMIEAMMAERMARILWLFQSKGCRHLVLGSFGTGVFKNNISMVASTWAELLALPHSKFFAVFERVEFAVLGNATYDEFRKAWEAKIQGLQLPKDAVR